VSYHIYTTKGITLSYRPFKEADRIYSILTRDLGLIRATALGVRKEASKLRGSLEPVVLANVSLVRGKEFWRITSAESLDRIESRPERLKPLALLERLVQGEAAHPELFDVVEKFLTTAGTLNSETSFVAHILWQLGYIKEADLVLPERELIKAINSGLEASHLND
jgi:DNA repair protein RecO (recombination protein O)